MTPFVPKNWVDAPATTTPISAAALEDLEDRVTDYTDDELAAAALADLSDVDAATAAVDGSVLTYDEASGKFVGQEQVPIDVDAKGDLLVGTAADTLARLPVGTNGQVLTAASGEATGLDWADAAGGGTALTLATADYLRARFTSLSTLAGGNGIAYYSRLLVPTARTFDQILCNVTIAAGTTGTARLAIFADTAGRPGATVLDAGTVDVQAATGVRSIAISQLLAAGYYWVALQNEHTGTAPTYSSGTGDISLSGPVINTLYTGAFNSRTGAFGASAGATTVVGTGMPLVALRAA